MRIEPTAALTTILTSQAVIIIIENSKASARHIVKANIEGEWG
jgi:hypothetical protein